MNEIFSEIKNLRLLKGVTQERLAAFCGLRRNYIAMVEKGATKPRKEVILAIFLALHVLA